MIIIWCRSCDNSHAYPIIQFCFEQVNCQNEINEIICRQSDFTRIKMTKYHCLDKISLQEEFGAKIA
jgi:hypothetical protein